MGTWGPGNFENDVAADYLHEVCKQMLGQIRATVSEQELMQPDEGDSEIMMCNLELLACLSENIRQYARGPIQDALFPRVLPDPAEVASWKAKYLAVWDACIDGLEPKGEYKTQRRAVIADTFDRVEHAARKQDQ